MDTQETNNRINAREQMVAHWVETGEVSIPEDSRIDEDDVILALALAREGIYMDLAMQEAFGEEVFEHESD